MTMTQTSFRLSEEELAVLDEIKATMGLPDRASAVRYALRQFSRENLSKPSVVYVEDEDGDVRLAVKVP